MLPPLLLQSVLQIHFYKRTSIVVVAHLLVMFIADLVGDSSSADRTTDTDAREVRNIWGDKIARYPPPVLGINVSTV